MKQLLLLCSLLFVFAATPVSGYVHQSAPTAVQQQPTFLEKVKSSIAQKIVRQSEKRQQIKATIASKKAPAGSHLIRNVWFWISIIAAGLGFFVAAFFSEISPFLTLYLVLTSFLFFILAAVAGLILLIILAVRRQKKKKAARQFYFGIQFSPFLTHPRTFDQLFANAFLSAGESQRRTN